MTLFVNSTRHDLSLSRWNWKTICLFVENLVKVKEPEANGNAEDTGVYHRCGLPSGIPRASCLLSIVLWDPAEASFATTIEERDFTACTAMLVFALVLGTSRAAHRGRVGPPL